MRLRVLAVFVGLVVGGVLGMPAPAAGAHHDAEVRFVADAGLRSGPLVRVPGSLKRNFERAVKRCGYFLERCPYGTWGERSLYAAGREIMCSPARSPYAYTYPSLSVRTPQKSWATMLVQFKFAWSQRTSGQRVTVAVDGRFGPVTERAWRNEARYAPISADGTVSGTNDWIWVFMFYCGD